MAQIGADEGELMTVTLDTGEPIQFKHRQILGGAAWMAWATLAIPYRGNGKRYATGATQDEAARRLQEYVDQLRAEGRGMVEKFGPD